MFFFQLYAFSPPIASFLKSMNKNKHEIKLLGRKTDATEQETTGG